MTDQERRRKLEDMSSIMGEYRKHAERMQALMVEVFNIQKELDADQTPHVDPDENNFLKINVAENIKPKTILN